MNRREALEILESVRPNSDDLNDPQFAEAVSWMDADQECAKIFAARQKIDRQISHAMSDVSVPAGLKKELIATLGLSEETPVAEVASPEMATPPVSRRRWLWITASSVACLVLGLFAWQHFSGDDPQFEMTNLQQMAATQMENWKELPSYSGPFSNPTKTLGYRWTKGSIAITLSPKGLPISQNDNHPIALFGFQVTSHSTSQFDGMLLVVDAKSVVNPPEVGYFSTSRANYISTKQGRFTTVTWQENDRVYICIVRDANMLDKLESALRTSTA